ncbi:CBS domain-containing protein [Pedobacter nutrimenti]|jgi:CBS domain-containing protein|uniref:CBS domain protein n=1 Tax=Pedobacter nutrimenti TaxID=1241337 RepID=A0A318UBG4_9SPHI|nr:CBS domain-containing protein [Pedobacter nutrimenti]PYF72750.1 CBS domain protein [Pedobacter nutrimenti]|eukprot:gene13533-15938_t
MKTVQQLLSTKSKEIFAVTAAISVLDALKVMMEKNISALLIMDQDQHLLGIFTERDYARKIILHGKSSLDTQISEVMTANPVTVKVTDSIEDCMMRMTEMHIRHLPAVENGKLIGMVSIGDVVKFIIEDQKHTINALESYINS